MTTIGINHPNATPMAGIGQDSASVSASNSQQAIKEITQLPATLGEVKAASNNSLVSTANGAPQIGNITVNFSPDDLAAALVVLQGKTQDAQMATAKEGLVTNGKKIEDQKQKSLDKIKDWVDKCKAAAAKAKAGGILGWFKKIFTAIAAVFAVAVSAIATVVTGGAAAPLLALAVLGLAASITDIASGIAKATGHKGFDHVLQWMDPGTLIGKGMAELAKAFGASDEQASIVSTTFAIATTIGIMIASIVLSGGANVADSVSKFTKTLSDTMAKVINTTMNLSRASQAVTGIVGGATSIAQGGINIAVAHDKRDAAYIQADKKKIDAALIKLQQSMEEAREEIKKVMDQIMEGINIVSQMINASGDNLKQINSRMLGKGMAA